MTHGMRTTAGTNAPHQRLSFPVVMMMLSITISARDPSLIPRGQTLACVLTIHVSASDWRPAFVPQGPRSAYYIGERPVSHSRGAGSERS